MSNRVYIGNVPNTATRADIATFIEAAIPSDNIDLKSGYAFVEYGSEEDARKVVEALQGKEISGRVVNVEVSKSRQAMYVSL